MEEWLSVTTGKPEQEPEAREDEGWSPFDFAEQSPDSAQAEALSQTVGERMGKMEAKSLLLMSGSLTAASDVEVIAHASALAEIEQPLACEGQAPQVDANEPAVLNNEWSLEQQLVDIKHMMPAADDKGLPFDRTEGAGDPSLPWHVEAGRKTGATETHVEGSEVHGDETSHNFDRLTGPEKEGDSGGKGDDPLVGVGSPAAPDGCKLDHEAACWEDTLGDGKDEPPEPVAGADDDSPPVSSILEDSPVVTEEKTKAAEEAGYGEMMLGGGEGAPTVPAAGGDDASPPINSSLEIVQETGGGLEFEESRGGSVMQQNEETRSPDVQLAAVTHFAVEEDESKSGAREVAEEDWGDFEERPSTTVMGVYAPGLDPSGVPMGNHAAQGQVVPVEEYASLVEAPFSEEYRGDAGPGQPANDKALGEETARSLHKKLEEEVEEATASVAGGDDGEDKGDFEGQPAGQVHREAKDVVATTIGGEEDGGDVNNEGSHFAAKVDGSATIRDSELPRESKATTEPLAGGGAVAEVAIEEKEPKGGAREAVVEENWGDFEEQSAG
ncbi:unnamed protein product, partial [Discosporangium mesarthrocarpum]